MAYLQRLLTKYYPQCSGYPSVLDDSNIESGNGSVTPLNMFAIAIHEFQVSLISLAWTLLQEMILPKALPLLIVNALLALFLLLLNENPPKALLLPEKSQPAALLLLPPKKRTSVALLPRFTLALISFLALSSRCQMLLKMKITWAMLMRSKQLSKDAKFSQTELITVPLLLWWGFTLYKKF